MLIVNGIVYEKFLYRHIRTKEVKATNPISKVTGLIPYDEIIEQYDIESEKELQRHIDLMHTPVWGNVMEDKWYNDYCLEWKEDGWTHLEYIMGFVSLNQ